MTHDELVARARQYLEYRGWLVVQTHGAKNRPIERGVTDLIAMRSGLNLLIEIKTGDDMLRPEQVAFADRAIARGVATHVIRTFEELTALMHRSEGTQ